MSGTFDRGNFAAETFDIDRFVDDVFHKSVNKAGTTPKDFLDVAIKAMEKLKKLHEAESKALEENQRTLVTVHKEQKENVSNTVGNIEKVLTWVHDMQTQLAQTCHDTVVTGSRLAECADRIRRSDEILQLSNHFESFMSIEQDKFQSLLSSLSTAREELRKQLVESWEDITEFHEETFDVFEVAKTPIHPKEKECIALQYLPDVFIKRTSTREAAVWVLRLGHLIRDINPDDDKKPIRPNVANGVRNISAYRNWLIQNLSGAFNFFMQEFGIMVDPRDIMSGKQSLTGVDNVSLRAKIVVIALKQIVGTFTTFDREEQLVNFYLGMSVIQARSQRMTSITVHIPEASTNLAVDTYVTNTTNEVGIMVDFYVALIQRESFLMTHAFGQGASATVKWVSKLIEDVFREEIESISEQVEALHQACVDLIDRGGLPDGDARKKDVATYHLSVEQAMIRNCIRFVTSVQPYVGDGAENIATLMDSVLLPRRTQYKSFQTEIQFLRLARKVCDTIEKDEDGNEVGLQMRVKYFMKDAEQAVRRLRDIATKDSLPDMCRDVCFEVLGCITSVAERTMVRCLDKMKAFVLESAKKPSMSPANIDIPGFREAEQDLLMWASWIQDLIATFDKFFATDITAALAGYPQVVNECSRKRTALFGTLETYVQQSVQCLSSIIVIRALYILQLDQGKKDYMPPPPDAKRDPNAPPAMPMDFTPACLAFCGFVKKEVAVLQSDMTLFGGHFLVMLCRGLLRGLTAHLKQFQVSEHGGMLLKKDVSMYNSLAVTLLNSLPAGTSTRVAHEALVVLDQYSSLTKIAGLFVVPINSVPAITNMGNLRYVGRDEMQQWVKMRVDWKSFGTGGK